MPDIYWDTSGPGTSRRLNSHLLSARLLGVYLKFDVLCILVYDISKVTTEKNFASMSGKADLSVSCDFLRVVLLAPKADFLSS